MAVQLTSDVFGTERVSPSADQTRVGRDVTAVEPVAPRRLGRFGQFGLRDKGLGKGGGRRQSLLHCSRDNTKRREQ